MIINYKDNTNSPVVEEKGGVMYLTYPALSAVEGFTHAFSTRIGGVSTGIYESMNLSFTRGDDETCVQENFTRFAKAVGVPRESIVMSDQTHTVNVRRVGVDDMGNGLIRPKSFFDTDGLITNEPGVTLFTSYADCVPLFFIDPVNKAIGLTHSGWRGTVGRIGKITVERMNAEFGTNPKDIVAAIGPSICADCYEVSEDVANEFKKEFTDNACKVVYNQREYYELKGIKRQAKDGKFQLDLWEANRLIMIEAGICEDKISVPGICTACNSDFLFSHRASSGKRGNLGAVLMINKE